MTPPPSAPRPSIRLRGAREHNLRSIDLDLPKHRLIVITGPSGSGKSSLALDTLFAEGQRRYLDTLSARTRQLLGPRPRPAFDALTGLSPTVTTPPPTASPRATVSTAADLDITLRVLFARAATAHCPTCATPVHRHPPGAIVEHLLALPEGTRLALLAPLVSAQPGDFSQLFSRLRHDGFARVRLDGAFYELTDLPPLAPQLPHTIDLVIDRLVIRDGLRPRLIDSLETALALGHDTVLVAFFARPPDLAPPDLRFSTSLRCSSCGLTLPELRPELFSPLSPYGACDQCSGMGDIFTPDPTRLIPDPTRALATGLLSPPGLPPLLPASSLPTLAAALSIPFNTPWSALTAAQRALLLDGPATPTPPASFPGLLPLLAHRFAHASRAARARLEPFMRATPCPACHGTRLRPAARAVRFAGHTLPDLLALPLPDLLHTLTAAPAALTPAHALIAAAPLAALTTRLQFLIATGLGYLTLARPLRTLSTGEHQRVHLAAHLGSELTDLVFVLDEPSAGLHPRDTTALTTALARLRDLGNTVILVEHDPDLMRASDWLVDLGPGAGTEGGHLLASCPPAALASFPASVTAPWLSGARTLPRPPARRTPTSWLTLQGAHAHNLHDLDVAIPLGVLTALTGVSGAGKSTLVTDVLLPAAAAHFARQSPPTTLTSLTGLDALQHVIAIDASRIGRSHHSNPATFTKIFDYLRILFASTPDAKARGYTPQRFSFNRPGGRCEACAGDGVLHVALHVLPDVWVPCSHCHGRRFNEATLAIRWRGLSIADVLDLTIAAARPIFAPIPKIARLLDTLTAVGLGYLQLGQPAPSLSSGEAQRLKLARELARPATAPTLYVLDEPTTGLHFDDIARLLDVLTRLLDAGHSVLLIEHHMDLVAAADWVIDLGPGGGPAGGRVVAAGPPEQVAATPHSFTGSALASRLTVSPPA